MKKGIEIAEQILKNENWKAFDSKTMADYDAIFDQQAEPVFINIWTVEKNQGYGYLAFHHFLERVGENNTFVTTQQTETGQHLIEKLTKQHILEEVDKTGNPAYPTRYKVLCDPIKNLQKWVLEEKSKKAQESNSFSKNLDRSSGRQ